MMNPLQQLHPLIVIPHPEKHGGVSGFIANLKNYLPANAAYMFSGALPEEQTIWQQIRRLFTNYYSFTKSCKSGKYNIIWLNPSLRIKSLIRDAVYIAIAPRFKIPVVVFWHGWDSRLLGKIAKSSVLRLLFQNIFNLASTHLVLAREFIEDFKRFGVTANIVPIRTAFDATVQQQADLAKDESFIILHLSRIEKMKGIYSVLDAFDILFQSTPQAQLIIAGDGSQLESAKNYLSSEVMQNVTFTGFVSGTQKTELLGKSSVLISPGVGEGMPVSILEAMYFGLPVITSRSGGVKDFFIDGLMGFSTDNLSGSNLAFLLKKLEQDMQLRNQMSAFNMDYAVTHFHPKIIAEKIVEILANVIKQ